MQARADIGRFDKAVIDAKDQDQRHLGDEQQAEKEGEALDRLLAAQLEGIIVEPIDRHSDHVEDRQHQKADHERIDRDVIGDDVGGVGAEQDKGRLRDIGDIEHAERDRDADSDRGIEAAEQDPGDDRVDQQIERDHRPRPVLQIWLRFCGPHQRLLLE